MQFKIDAKDQYTVITPQNDTLNALLAAELAVECRMQSGSGSQNFIIDLENCTQVQSDFVAPFIELSAAHYENEQSFVLTNPPADMLSILKEQDEIDSLNTAPTFIEAIDIVSMEILERDLFKEE